MRVSPLYSQAGREEESPIHMTGVPATRKTVGPGPGAEARLERISGLALSLLSEMVNQKSKRVIPLFLTGDDMSRC